MVKVIIRVMGRIRIRVIVGVIDAVYVVWCKKSIVKKVLVLVLAILFNSGVGIGNTLALAILFTSIVSQCMAIFSNIRVLQHKITICIGVVYSVKACMQTHQCTLSMLWPYD